jgi:GntR family transcriptional repressor for pyruvate dehydrogenase complex
MSRLHEQIMRIEIADIVSQRIRSGEWLPPAAALAAQFGVSRGVARECIRGLEERGLVAVRHGRGATVLPQQRWDVLDPDVLRALLDHGRGPVILGDFLESRRIVEISAAGLAAERATPDDLRQLSGAFDRMTAAARRALENPAAEDLYHEADIGFHRALIDATGNRALGALSEPIQRALIAARRPLARPDLRLERSLPEHRRILTAVAEGDVDAARDAMRAHLLTVEAYLREYARTAGEPPADADRRRAG